MAKIVRYELDHYHQEMLIDLDVTDRLPDEIKIIINDMVVTYRHDDRRFKKK